MNTIRTPWWRAGLWALVGIFGLGLLVFALAPLDHGVLESDDGQDVSSADADRIILNPTADLATSQTISWRTDHTVTKGVVEVRIGAGIDRVAATTSDEFTVENAAEGQDVSRSHSATLTDLTPDTVYEYRVGDGDQHWSRWYAFTTAAKTHDAFQFLYVSDVQNDRNISGARAMREAFENSPDAQLVLHGGDLIDDPENDDERAEWFAADPNVFASINHLATAGNHEYAHEELHPGWDQSFTFPTNGPEVDSAEPVTCEGVYEAQVSELMANTVYYTDYQGVRFIVLNANIEDLSELTPPTDELAAGDCDGDEPDLAETWLEVQAQWLDDVADAAPGVWTVVMHHQPVFSAAEDRDNPSVRDAWLEAIQQADVDLVLSGHDHTYARGHLIDDVIDSDTGLYSGPTFAVSVTGPKMYDLADPSQWGDWGANQVVTYEDTQFYQRVDIDGSKLRYEAVEVGTGEVLDSFALCSDDSGTKYGANSAGDLPENCG